MSSPNNTGQTVNDLVGKMYIARSYALLTAPMAVEHVEENTRLLLLDIDVEWRDSTSDEHARVSLYFKLMLPSGNIAWWIHQTMLETESEVMREALLKFLEWADPVPEPV